MYKSIGIIIMGLGRPTDEPKNKMFSMRTTEKFLETLDELGDAFGMSRTGVVEFSVTMLPTLAKQLKRETEQR
jgi:hypothetical protein